MASHGRQKRQKKENHVPEELIMSILVNLPVNVSKLSRSLIIDQDFIEQHLSNQQKKDPQILFASADVRGQQIALKSMVINVDGADEGTGAAVIDGLRMTIEDLPQKFFSMMYSCDGVFCFYGAEAIIVCNPSTREIQRPEVSRRKLGEAPYSVSLSSAKRPVHVNGAIYWITSFRRHPLEAIVSFDLHTQKFKAIPHPSCLDNDFKRYEAALKPLRNSLCLAELTNANKRMNIWIFMKGCNSSPGLNDKMGTWEMLHSIDLEIRVHDWPMRIPIAGHKNGMLSTNYYGYWVQLYNPKRRMFTNVLSHWRTFAPTAYFESLVPLSAKKKGLHQDSSFPGITKISKLMQLQGK
ncbi:F-box associated domain [Theobroma cacao]|nr:F-box associated domain [Theobroma cacao]